MSRAASIPGGVRAPAEGALSLSLRRSRPRVSCAPGSTQDGVAACAAGASRANSGINGTRPGFGALAARVASPRALSAAAALFALALHTLTHTYQKQSAVCSDADITTIGKQPLLITPHAERKHRLVRSKCCSFANFVCQSQIHGLENFRCSFDTSPWGY